MYFTKQAVWQQKLSVFHNLTLGDFASVVRQNRLSAESLSPEAQVIIGARINKDFEGKVRVITIMTGVKSPYILGKARESEENSIELKSRMSDLGIDFVG